ncbi:hypothetical protein KEM52_002656 [Ascosphaera acerosa]|nr:hypothetical protein KEM52_002656 [Ascosphaera acerosa]
MGRTLWPLDRPAANSAPETQRQAAAQHERPPQPSGIAALVSDRPAQPIEPAVHIGPASTFQERGATNSNAQTRAKPQSDGPSNLPPTRRAMSAQGYWQAVSGIRLMALRRRSEGGLMMGSAPRGYLGQGRRRRYDCPELQAVGRPHPAIWHECERSLLTMRSDEQLQPLVRCIARLTVGSDENGAPSRTVPSIVAAPPARLQMPLRGDSRARSRARRSSKVRMRRRRSSVSPCTRSLSDDEGEAADGALAQDSRETDDPSAWNKRQAEHCLRAGLRLCRDEDDLNDFLQWQWEARQDEVPDVGELERAQEIERPEVDVEYPGYLEGLDAEQFVVELEAWRAAEPARMADLERCKARWQLTLQRIEEERQRRLRVGMTWYCDLRRNTSCNLWLIERARQAVFNFMDFGIGGDRPSLTASPVHPKKKNAVWDSSRDLGELEMSLIMNEVDPAWMNAFSLSEVQAHVPEDMVDLPDVRDLIWSMSKGRAFRDGYVVCYDAPDGYEASSGVPTSWSTERLTLSSLPSANGR